MTQNSINSGYGTADGEILIGATGGRMLPSTLTAGANISIVNAANSITITGTGGGGGGGVVQQVRTQSNAVISCTSVFPYDNTIPQITEGDEVMSVSITPTSASSVLGIEFFSTAGVIASAVYSGALFQDGGADAIASQLILWCHSVTQENITCSFVYYLTAGTTEETTFMLRAGPWQLNRGIFFNGDEFGNPKYGGTVYTNLAVTEYSA